MFQDLCGVSYKNYDARSFLRGALRPGRFAPSVSSYVLMSALRAL